MIARRIVLGWPVAAACVAIGPRLASAQTKMARIGYLRRSGPIASHLDALRQGLREMGFIEGRNLAIETRHADGAADRLPALAVELIALNVDVLVVDGALTVEAARRVAGRTPIVFAIVPDPVGAGLVASLARPGGTITGIVSAGDWTNPKRLELLKELLPALRRAALIHNPLNDQPGGLAMAEQAAQRLGIALRMFPASARSQWDATFLAIRHWDAGGAVQANDATFGTDPGGFVDLSLRHRLPMVHAEDMFVRAGGLISYSASLDDNWRRAARLVAKILQGANPAEVPVEFPSKLTLSLNLKTARALGISVPQSILFRADEVIE